MRSRSLLLLFVGLISLSAGLSAQTPSDRREATVERRADRQQRRIGRGVQNGQLTPRETLRLERQEARIDRHIAKAEADGKMTKAEARKITREQNRESRRIRRQKHDAQAK